MKLSDGTNTISDALFEVAAIQMAERHSDEYDMLSDGLHDHITPGRLAEQQSRERDQLYADRDTLGVQEWLKQYPASATAQQPPLLDDMRKRLDNEIKTLSERLQDRTLDHGTRATLRFSLANALEASDDVYAQIRSAARRGQDAPWRGLVTPDNHRRAAESIAAARPSHLFTEGKMADSYSSEGYWQKRALEIQRNAPVRVQGELFQQQQRREQIQRAAQQAVIRSFATAERTGQVEAQAPTQGQPWRPILVQ